MAVLRLVIEEVLDALPPGHRPIVERRIEGYEVAEIAETVAAVEAYGRAGAPGIPPEAGRPDS